MLIQPLTEPQNCAPTLALGSGLPAPRRRVRSGLWRGRGKLLQPWVWPKGGEGPFLLPRLASAAHLCEPGFPIVDKVRGIQSGPPSQDCGLRLARCPQQQAGGGGASEDSEKGPLPDPSPTAGQATQPLPLSHLAAVTFQGRSAELHLAEFSQRLSECLSSIKQGFRAAGPVRTQTLKTLELAAP